MSQAIHLIRISNPESQIQNTNFGMPNPESRMPNLELDFLQKLKFQIWLRLEYMKCKKIQIGRGGNKINMYCL